jgi:hypothetical protein
MTKIFSGIRISLENISRDIFTLNDDYSINPIDVNIKVERTIYNKKEVYMLIDLYFEELKKHGIIKGDE